MKLKSSFGFRTNEKQESVSEIPECVLNTVKRFFSNVIEENFVTSRIIIIIAVFVREIFSFVRAKMFASNPILATG